MNYFTLHALAAEWNDVLSGAIVVDVWSQSANELSLALEKGREECTIRVHCDPRMVLLFRVEGHGRARRNTATLFESAHGRTVSRIRTAERDRYVFIELDDGSAFQLQLFGSRPNVFLAGWDGLVKEAFQLNTTWAGQAAPAPRPAPKVSSFEVFEERWRADRKTLMQAVSTAIPLFDRQLAEEVVHRAEVNPAGAPSEASEEELRRLFDVCMQLEEDLQSPRPIVYWRGAFAEVFSLIPLRSLPKDWRAEPFDSVDAALGVFSKRQLGQRRFLEAYKPLESALAAEHLKRTRSALAILSELENSSRADGYEARAHLLMAQAADQAAGHEDITLPDILNDGEAVTIKLDPALTAVENAQRFYLKARQTREARRHAKERWASIQAQADEAGRLLEQLHALEHYADLEVFLKDNKAALAQSIRPEAVGEERLPYRRFEIDGWEIRVGKNAKSNAALTTKLSGPHDLWLHARGVPGSHVVIPRPNKTAQVPKPIIEAAARIAAYFSDAKTQPLAPVIVTERKYVRPVKGGPPGLVRVDREDVVMVAPGLPN